MLNLLCSLRSYLYLHLPLPADDFTSIPRDQYEEPLTSLPQSLFLHPPFSSSSLLNTQAISSQGRPFPLAEFMKFFHSHFPSQLSFSFILFLYWLFPLNVESQGWLTLSCVYQQPCSILPKKAICSGNSSPLPSTKGCLD